MKHELQANFASRIPEAELRRLADKAIEALAFVSVPKNDPRGLAYALSYACLPMECACCPPATVERFGSSAYFPQELDGVIHYQAGRDDDWRANIFFGIASALIGESIEAATKKRMWQLNELGISPNVESVVWLARHLEERMRLFHEKQSYDVASVVCEHRARPVLAKAKQPNRSADRHRQGRRGGRRAASGKVAR